MHDPTQEDGQCPDLGTQYRSGIWCSTEEQLRIAKNFVAEQYQNFDRPIVTEVEMADTFYIAEAAHQDYINRTGQMYCHHGNPWPKIFGTARKEDASL